MQIFKPPSPNVPISNQPVFWLALATALIFLSQPVAAQNSRSGILSVLFENDLITGSDNNYTNGVGASWTSNRISNYPNDSLIYKWSRWWSFLPGVHHDDDYNNVSWTLGQEMHTPDDITREMPPPDDQPYAGVLYLDSDINSRHGRWSQSWHLRAGLTGPASGADRLQRWVHRNVSADLPRGWDSQLPNEVIINIGFTGGYRVFESVSGSSITTRLTSLFNVEVGNYSTSLSAGGLVEIGKHLPAAISLSSLGKGLNTAMVANTKPLNRWSWSVFSGLGTSLYAHFLPLDGTVFRDSPSVDSEPIVGFGAAGLSLRYGRFAVSLAATRFTRTFRTQRRNVDYGIVSVAWYL